MYKIVYLPTGEEITKPINNHANLMTIKQVRRYLRSNKSYPVRYRDKEIYFTDEGEFQDTHPNYNKEFCDKMGRVKISKDLIRVIRIK
jgi:hypothetical protein